MSSAIARFWDDWHTVAALVIFAGTYFVVALGKLPGYRLDRAGAALLGAALMVGFGVLPLEAAYRAIDFNTITLLLGMMILVANLKLSGFFSASERLGHAACSAPTRAAGRCCSGVRVLFGVPGQRYHLPDHDADRCRACPFAPAQPGSLAYSSWSRVSSTRVSCPRSDRDRTAPPAILAGAGGADRGSVERRQQRACGASSKTILGGSPGPATRLAGGSYGLDPSPAISTLNRHERPNFV